jgi:uncharacterized membrane protein
MKGVILIIMFLIVLQLTMNVNSIINQSDNIESILFSSIIHLWNDSKTGDIYMEKEGETELLIKHENVILKKIKYSVVNILYFIEIQLFIYVLAYFLTQGKPFVFKEK